MIEELILQNLKSFKEHTLDEILFVSCRSLLWIKRNFTCVHPSPFKDPVSFTHALQKYAYTQNLRLDPNLPSCGGYHSTHHIRWHVVIPPQSSEGPLVSLRWIAHEALGLENFALTLEQERLFDDLFAKKVSMMICGPTGCGKTTFLLSLLKRYSKSERIAFIEESEEIPLLSPLWIRQLSRRKGREHDEIPLQQAFKDSLRLNPERIVFGEIRGDEGLLFFEARNSGHRGTLTTFHAGSKHEVEKRLQMMFERNHYHFDLNGEPLYLVFLDKGSPPSISEISSFL